MIGNMLCFHITALGPYASEWVIAGFGMWVNFCIRLLALASFVISGII